MPELETQSEETVQDSPELEVSDAEQEPEPAAEATSDEGESDAEPTGETHEEETADTDDNWLPDEQAKVYPVDVLLEYAAKRFPNLSKELIAKDPGVQELLKGKLDADIYIRNNPKAQQGEAGDEEETGDFLIDDGLDEQAESVPEVDNQTTVEPDAVRAQHYQRVDDLVSRVDKTAASEAGKSLLSAMGVNADPEFVKQVQNTVAKDQAALRGGQLADNQRLAIQQRLDSNQQYLDTVNGASKLGNSLARMYFDQTLTVLPQLLPDLIESAFPGTQASYRKQIVGSTWQQLSTVLGKDQKPLYPSLPAFGSTEFVALVRKTEKALGLKQYGLETFNRYDANGNPLPFDQHAKYVTRLIAKTALGQKISTSPQAVSQALQTGAQKERDKAQRRGQGRALGSGQPTSSSGAADGNEDIFGPGLAEYKRRGG